MRIDNPSISGSLSFIGGTNSISATSVSLTGSLTGTFEGAFSGGTLNNISGAFDSVSASLASDITANASSITSLNAATSSYALQANISGAFADTSSSLSQRVTVNEESISSLNAASSSYLLNTTDTLTGDLTVTGTITAQEFHTEFVSASIVYQSGSTQFGNSADDTHVFTGTGSFDKVGIGTATPTQILQVVENGGIFSVNPTVGGVDLHSNANFAPHYQTNFDWYTGEMGSGTFRMRLNSNGNLGIGTTSPAGDLEISGSRTITFNPGFNDHISISSMRVSATGFNAFTIGEANTQNNSAAIRFAYSSAGSTSNYLGLGFYANDDKVTIKADGNVGIGTNSPLTALHLHTGAASSATGSFQDNTALGIESTSDQYIEMLTSGGSSGQMQGILFSDNGRNAFVGYKEYTGAVADTKGEALHLAFYDYSASDSNNGIYFGTSNTPWLGVNTTHMFIKGNGNVGIGTTSPLGRLHILAPDPATDFNLVDFRNSGGYGIYAKTNSISSRGNTLEFLAVDYNSGGTTLTREALSLRPEGNVGMGIANPSSKLTVKGVGGGGTIRIVPNSTNAEASIGYYQDTAGTVSTTRWVAGVGGWGNTGKFTIGYGDAGPDLSIDTAGKVGIGVTSPGVQLHVESDQGGSHMFRLKNTNSTSNGYAEMQIYNDVDDRIVLGSIGSGYTGSPEWENSSYIYDVGQDYLRIKASSQLELFSGGMALANRRLVINSTGNVGIGVTSPNQILDINGNIKFGTWATAGSRYIGFVRDDNGAFGTAGASGLEIESGNFGGAGNYDQKVHIWTHTYNGGSSRRLTVDNYGNVGIGIASPTQKLHVEGAGIFGTSIYRASLDGGGAGAYLRYGTTADNDSLGTIGTYSSAMMYETAQSGGHVFSTGAGVGGTERMRIAANGDIKNNTNYKSVGWNWVTTPYHYYVATTSDASVTVAVNSGFTTNGNSAIPSYAKALYVTYYYHISGYGIGSAGQGDHANDIWGPDAPSTTTSWSFTTSGNYDWGSAVFMHDGDSSETGDMGYYGVWHPGAIIPVNSNGNIYGLLSHGWSGGTHYHHMYVWGYSI